MWSRISNKIIISYALLIAILIVFLLFFFNDLVKDTHLKTIKREMREKIRFIELTLRQNPGITPHKNNRKIEDIINEISQIIDLRITLIDLHGKVVADSQVDDIATMDNHRYRTEINDSIKNGTGESIRYSNTIKVDMLYLAKRDNSIVIRLAKPLFDLNESTSKVRKLIIFFGFMVLVIAVIITVFISKKITRPIKDTVDFARDFSHGDYSKRLLNYSDDEIGTLQRSLNSMADTIVEKINSLILEQNKLLITIETIDEGIAVIDRNKTLLIANRAFNRIFEINIVPDGKMYFEVIRSSSLNSKIEYCLNSGTQSSFEEELLSGNVFEIYINPIKEEKTIRGILIVMHDITEKKRIEQLKTELVGNMSHELKTPIAILKGYLETIDKYITDTKLCRDLIKKAIKNVDRQNSVISDMLKLNLMETIPFVPDEKINLKEIIENCVELLAPKAASRNIEVNIDLNAVGQIIKGSRFLAEEIFFNIIENAIHYNNQSGNIDITASNSENRTSITISDTGIGIPEESMDRIFERFYRVNKSRSRSTGGTGLGLSIVKHGLELLNWSIQVTSSSRGTSFIIVI